MIDNGIIYVGAMVKLDPRNPKDYIVGLTFNYPNYKETRADLFASNSAQEGWILRNIEDPGGQYFLDYHRDLFNSPLTKQNYRGWWANKLYSKGHGNHDYAYMSLLMPKQGKPLSLIMINNEIFSMFKYDREPKGKQIESKCFAFGELRPANFGDLIQ